MASYPKLALRNDRKSLYIGLEKSLKEAHATGTEIRLESWEMANFTTESLGLQGGEKVRGGREVCEKCQG